jgi:alpha-tubulin suppressor-like RCC1 family protein
MKNIFRPTNRLWLAVKVIGFTVTIFSAFQNCSMSSYDSTSSRGKVQTASTDTICNEGMAEDIHGNCVLISTSCNFNGNVVGNNDVITAFSQAVVPYPGVCEPETRSCSNGKLSGNFAYSSCQVSNSGTPNPTITPNPTGTPNPGANASCTFGTITLAHGASTTGYSVAQVSFGYTCSAQSASVLCNNGSLSPSNLYASCSVAKAKPNRISLGGFFATDPITGLVTNHSHGCYIISGALKCAGYNTNGQLGNGTVANSNILTAVSGLEIDVSQVATGNAHTCALKNGAVYCWGKNSSGEVGMGAINANKYSGPQMALNLNSGVTQIAVGNSHGCAIKASALYCWGQNANGELGDGTNVNNSTPKIVSGMESGVTDVALGVNHSCSIKSGALYCWGKNSNYQIGDNTSTAKNQPVPLGLPNVTMVATHANGTCAISNAVLFCWGDNNYYQAGQGDGSSVDIRLPEAVNLVRPIKVFTHHGAQHVCAVDDTGANGVLVKCWGRNNLYQLGLEVTGKVSTPTTIFSGNDLADLSLSTVATCAVKQNGDLYCWGTNTNGFMGIGSTTTYPRFKIPTVLYNTN